MAVLWLPDRSTWPVEVLDFLENNRDFIIDWHFGTDDGSPFSRAKERAMMLKVAQHELLVGELSGIISDYSIRGYHNTRLTEAEIAEIKTNGMSLPCPALLDRRIDALVDAKEISNSEGDALKGRNQADEEFRRDRIFFCYYEPRLSGQSGVEDLLRNWGGEALYNSHDKDIRTGSILRRVGEPCIIEAEVPIAWLNGVDDLSIEMMKDYANGCITAKARDFRFEASCLSPLPAPLVTRVIQYSDADFSRLTGCDTWTPRFKPYQPLQLRD